MWSKIRPNIMTISLGLLVVAAVCMYIAGTASNASLADTASNLALVAVAGVVAFGTNILQLDSQPFDAAKAQHEERLKQIDAEQVMTTAKAEANRAVRIKQLELDHEFRNGQNAAMLKLIDAATVNTYEGEVVGTGTDPAA